MVISLKVKNEVLERDDFTCQKCGFRDASGKDLEIHHLNPKIFNGNEELQNLSILCSICHKHAPDNEKEFSDYISDKIDTKILDTFRKSNYSISKKTKAGMSETFKHGLHITKAPRGYRLVNKKLVINESEAEQVKTIFSEFLNNNISLTQLAKKYATTVRKK